MTYASALSGSTRVELRSRRTRATTARQPAALDAAALGGVGSIVASALSQARRTQNRTELGVATELRCECDAAACRVMCPAVADTHRGLLDRFVVSPAHLGAATVVRVADRFVIVEPGRA